VQFEAFVNLLSVCFSTFAFELLFSFLFIMPSRFSSPRLALISASHVQVESLKIVFVMAEEGKNNQQSIGTPSQDSRLDSNPSCRRERRTNHYRHHHYSCGWFRSRSLKLAHKVSDEEEKKNRNLHASGDWRSLPQVITGSVMANR
jgi:hypothetical protein